jgi:hypothetical protein
MASGRRVDDAKAARIAKLYASGVQTAVLVERFHLNHTTILDCVRRNGVPVREQSGKEKKDV